MSGRINTFRTAVRDHIRAILPNLASCETQFGRFDIDALDKMIIKAPSVRFAVLTGDGEQEAADRRTAILACAAFIITEGKGHEEAGWEIAEAIFTQLGPAQLWGLTRLSGVSKARIQPIVTGDLKMRTVSIMAVEWKQSLYHLGTGIFNDAGVALTQLYVQGEPVDLTEGGADA